MSAPPVLRLEITLPDKPRGDAALVARAATLMVTRMVLAHLNSDDAAQLREDLKTL